jgi:hypothetical protein
MKEWDVYSEHAGADECGKHSSGLKNDEIEVSLVFWGLCEIGYLMKRGDNLFHFLFSKVSENSKKGNFFKELLWIQKIIKLYNHWKSYSQKGQEHFNPRKEKNY